ncbi:hypothetical protein [Pelosinus baikalensis]|nr:hypothetical protein [Pelosinus baikalensis]
MLPEEVILRQKQYGFND